MLVLLAGGLAFTARATPVSPDPATTPYQTIVDRNVFALKPPPPPPSAEEAKPPPVKITLTGITTIVGKRALMKSPAPPGKPGEPAKPELSYILAEGQREGDVEVLEIDDKSGNVKINNAGVVVTLNIDKDGPKLPTTGLPPGVPPPPMGAMPGSRVITPFGGGNPGFTMPARTLRLPPANGGLPSSGMPSAGMNPMFNGTGIPQPQTSQPQQPAASLEQQILLLETQREMNKNNPNFPPLPPTPLSEGAGTPGSTPAQTGPPSFPILPRPGGLPPIPQ